MLVKTKKFELDPKTYRKVGIRHILKEQWWLPASIFGGIILLNVIINLLGYKNIWIYFLAPIGAWGWYAFWWIQYTGLPQLPQNRPMFEKFTYEINSQQILVKKSAQEGMVIKWDMIKKAYRFKDAFTLVLSKAQFFHFPLKVFNSEADIRFMEVILQRKNLLVASNQLAATIKTPASNPGTNTSQKKVIPSTGNNKKTGAKK